MERNLNKVYINPNFAQRSSGNSLPLQSKSHMHVNPKFPQMHINNNLEHNCNLMKRRIFVNPNFVPPNTAFTTPAGMNYQTVAQAFHGAANNCTNTQARYAQFSSDMTKEVILKSTVQPSVSPSISKSRYKLVRRKIEVCVSNIERSANKNSTTIKINKYKTARLSYIKDNNRTVEMSKVPTNEVPPSSRINHPLRQTEQPKTPLNASASYGKYVKINKSGPSMKKIGELKSSITKRTALVRKSTLHASFRINRKVIAGKFKKNNIPCPLFSKYGKCLRNIHGHCEFLHDRKHVSLCRKFLKGICHDPNCRFSHELSAKKMPTCYFYLKGMCTKDNCPYLHVKLNNEAKICNDFMKGYCEKGDKCDFRHVNKSLQSVISRSMKIQRHYTCSSPIVVSKSKIKMRQSVQVFKKNEIKRKSLSNSKQPPNDKADVECRYFKETEKTTDQDEVCDVIKPSRCKLGTLPSFIKL